MRSTEQAKDVRVGTDPEMGTVRTGADSRFAGSALEFTAIEVEPGGGGAARRSTDGGNEGVGDASTTPGRAPVTTVGITG